MTNSQFMCGLIAQLWRQGLRRFNARNAEFHHAFGQAIDAVGDSKLRLTGVDFYIDPITGTIDDLFHITSLLQGHDLATRPNPTYSETQLDLSERACDELLKPLGDSERELIEAFAERFSGALNSAAFAR